MNATANGRPIDYSGLPEHMQDAMRLYMENGIQPGGFLSAVLCNDLMGAVARADSTNRNLIPQYAVWLYNKAPRASHGSDANFAAWIKSRHEAAQ